MSRMATFGNDLYTGKRSFDFIGQFKYWMISSLVLVLLVLGGLAVRGLNMGIEFTGGSDFRIAGVANTDNFAERATDVVRDQGGEAAAPTVTLIGADVVRVQTQQLDERRTQDVTEGLASTFGVSTTDVSASVIGPSWGESVSRQALQALIVFLVLVALMLSVYFRTWKMSLAAMIALAHDVLITVGIYSIVGFEITPATMIGFLTILSYSLYDTVVVFDKVRENTAEAVATGRRTYSEATNHAINQTLVRSINTSVVALLPVACILVVGFWLLGPGTLLDLSLALFIGIAFGTYSSIFIAAPLLAWMREREPGMKQLRERVEARTQGTAPPVTGPQAVLAAAAPTSTGATTGGARAAAGSAAQVFGAGIPGMISPGTAGSGGGATALAERNGEAAADDANAGAPVEYTATGRPIHPSMRRAEPPRGRKGRGSKDRDKVVDRAPGKADKADKDGGQGLDKEQQDER